MNEDADVVHVDLDGAWLGRNYDADIAVQAAIDRDEPTLLDVQVDPYAVPPVLV